ncbi:hypothetical protein DFH06DRAFT_1470822 [Mycena polygramma]|nr:hypothetical protein DFH06DRAFT_1470822 [Mycena polygramma]
MTSFLSLPLARAPLAYAARRHNNNHYGPRTPEDDLTDALAVLARVDAACAAQLARIDLAWDRIISKGLASINDRPATRAAFEGEVQTEWLALKAKGDAVVADKKNRKQRKREKAAAAQQKAARADGGTGEAGGSRRRRRAKGKTGTCP